MIYQEIVIEGRIVLSEQQTESSENHHKQYDVLEIME